MIVAALLTTLAAALPGDPHLPRRGAPLPVAAQRPGTFSPGPDTGFPPRSRYDHHRSDPVGPRTRCDQSARPPRRVARGRGVDRRRHDDLGPPRRSAHTVTWHWGSGGEWLGRRYLRTRCVSGGRSTATCKRAGRATAVWRGHSWPRPTGCPAPWSAWPPMLGAASAPWSTAALPRIFSVAGSGHCCSSARRPDRRGRIPHPVRGRGPRWVGVVRGGDPSGQGGAQWLGVALELVTCVEPTSADGLPWGDRDSSTPATSSGTPGARAPGMGDPARQAPWARLRGARPGRAGLIVASTHGRGGLARIVDGSVVVRIVHQAPCPVLLVPPGRPPEPTRADGPHNRRVEDERPWRN